MALLVRRHFGGEGAYRVVGGVLGNVDVEVLRAPLGAQGESDRLTRVLGRRDLVGLRAEIVPGVLPADQRRQLALGGADGERLVLLLLFLADALELLGDVVEADVAHEALELDEALEGVALDDERVRIKFEQGLRQ